MSEHSEARPRAYKKQSHSKDSSSDIPQFTVEAIKLKPSKIINVSIELKLPTDTATAWTVGTYQSESGFRYFNIPQCLCGREPSKLQYLGKNNEIPSLFVNALARLDTRIKYNNKTGRLEWPQEDPVAVPPSGKSNRLLLLESWSIAKWNLGAKTAEVFPRTTPQFEPTTQSGVPFSELPSYLETHECEFVELLQANRAAHTEYLTEQRSLAPLAPKEGLSELNKAVFWKAQSHRRQQQLLNSGKHIEQLVKVINQFQEYHKSLLDIVIQLRILHSKEINLWKECCTTQHREVQEYRTRYQTLADRYLRVVNHKLSASLLKQIAATQPTVDLRTNTVGLRPIVQTTYRADSQFLRPSAPEPVQLLSPGYVDAVEQDRIVIASKQASKVVVVQGIADKQVESRQAEQLANVQVRPTVYLYPETGRRKRTKPVKHLGIGKKSRSGNEVNLENCAVTITDRNLNETSAEVITSPDVESFLVIDEDSDPGEADDLYAALDRMQAAEGNAKSPVQVEPVLSIPDQPVELEPLNLTSYSDHKNILGGTIRILDPHPI
jgi:hypothetical protein